MATITAFPGGGCSQNAPTEQGSASPRIQALLLAVRQWWLRARYRPERRYMRG